MNQEPRASWIQAVRRQFAEGPPNGWLLGWDHDRLWDALREAVPGEDIENYTSFDYAFCNHYEIRVPGESEECYWQLVVLISCIVDAYSIHWTYNEQGGKVGRVVDTPATERHSRLYRDVERMLESRGFRDVPVAWQQMRIRGVELELSEPEDVRLGKCLFQDYDG